MVCYNHRSLTIWSTIFNHVLQWNLIKAISYCISPWEITRDLRHIKDSSTFSFLSCFVEYDEHDSPAEGWKKDKFACFREFLEYICKRFLRYRRLSEHLATDEIICHYREGTRFKQYNPKKLGKYGHYIVAWAIQEFSIRFTH